MASSNHNLSIAQYAIGLGDDALTLGHRLSEWCSHGPYLEEDIALINISLDYIGRARMFLDHAATVEGEGRDEDQLAYFRDDREFRNRLIFELPRGDFAETIARQCIVDPFYVLFFEALMQSKDPVLAGIAGKAIKESRYHWKHTHSWMLRLGDGTAESHQRILTALDEVWGYHFELFEMTDLDRELLDAGIAVDLAALKPKWDSMIDEVLTAATLTRPEDTWRQSGGRNGEHTEHLGHLLTELQFIQRAHPGLQW